MSSVGADSVGVAISADAPARLDRGVARESLTRRAALTALASLFDYAVQLIVGLVLTPILVRGLGAPLFGIWEMLRQAVGYMTATDGRPTDALRLVIASRQASSDLSHTPRYVGGALVVWLLFVPLVLAAGSLIVWLAPAITKVGPEMRMSIRVACAFLVVSFLAGTMAAIPEAVLRGMNLGYKRMGWQAALSVAWGVLAASAVYAGWELVGLGGAQIVLACLTGICFWMLARKYVPVFGVARPGKPEIRSLLSMSAWLTGGLVLSNVLLSSDVVLLGILVSPAAVTMYVLTGSASRMAISLFNFTVGAATPGLGGLIGRGEYDRVHHVRTELVTLTWLFVSSVGVTMLIWNRSFVSLWVGSEHYAGVWANVLITCMMVQTAFIRGDGFIIDAALRPRPRVIVTAIAAVLSIALMFALTPAFGIVGLCLAIFAGRLVQTVVYPRLVASYLHRSAGLSFARVVRPLAVMLASFTIAAYLGQRVVVNGWIEFAGAVTLTVPLTCGMLALLGLPSNVRHALQRRCFDMLRSFRR